MSVAWVVRCAAVAAVIVAAAGPARAGCSLVLAASLPVQFTRSWRVAVPVTINGIQISMTFDTGGATNALSSATAAKLNLSEPDRHGSGDDDEDGYGVGGWRGAHQMVARKVQIGDMQGHAMAIEVMRPGRPGQVDEDLLGVDFLGNVDIDIDVLAARITLYGANGDCSQPSTPLKGELYTTQLLQTDDDEDIRPHIAVTLGGRRLRAIIDTGTDGLAMTRRAARDIGVTDAMLAADAQTTATGIGGTVPIWHHLFAKMDIGDVSLGPLRMAVVNQPQGDDWDVLLGMKFLRLVHVWISRSSGTVIMQVPPLPPVHLPGKS